MKIYKNYVIGEGYALRRVWRHLMKDALRFDYVVEPQNIRDNSMYAIELFYETDGTLNTRWMTANTFLWRVCEDE